LKTLPCSGEASVSPPAAAAPRGLALAPGAGRRRAVPAGAASPLAVHLHVEALAGHLDE
jgi:hypothetical protein